MCQSKWHTIKVWLDLPKILSQSLIMHRISQTHTPCIFHLFFPIFFLKRLFIKNTQFSLISHSNCIFCMSTLLYKALKLIDMHFVAWAAGGAKIHFYVCMYMMGGELYFLNWIFEFLIYFELPQKNIYVSLNTNK